MTIDPQRILADFDAIAAFSEAAPAVGHSRPTFSPPWRQAKDYVIQQAESAGCKTYTDASGNLHIRPGALPWETPAWLSGSHLDSVPTGGKYDGVMGVVVPLEVLRAAHAAGRVVPLEVINFAEEEGTTFGLGMIGSRLWTDPGWADHVRNFLNHGKQDFFTAGAADGVSVDRLVTEKFNPAAYLGLVEIHAEQGPAMWAEHVPLAVVTAIAGRKQYKVIFAGTANHAGSTPMRYRADPLVAAARVIAGIDAMARSFHDATVATVGKMNVSPNAVNVIPGRVEFTIDVRSPSGETLAACDRQIAELIGTAGAAEDSLTVTEDQPPVAMDRGVIEALTDAAGGTLPTAISGALHDSAILAPFVPTAMLFVASQDGISHNPAEFSRIEDITAAAELLYKLVCQS